MVVFIKFLYVVFKVHFLLLKKIAPAAFCQTYKYQSSVSSVIPKHPFVFFFVPNDRWFIAGATVPTVFIELGKWIVF